MIQIQLGDVGTWFASIGTVGTLLFTLIGLSHERIRRHSLEKKAQASHISAWVASEENGKAWLAVLNQSKDPIYEVVLSIVSFNESESASGKHTPSEYRDYLSVVPPNKHYGCVESNYHGMGFHPTVEIAFKDINGQCWLRTGNGTLKEIPVAPVDYYHLALPIEWQLPEQQIPSKQPQ